MRAITVQELRRRLEAEDAPVVLDVREPWERALCALPGSCHIPMRDVPNRIAELSPEAEIVVVCHHGVRSLHVATFLEREGFERLCNLTGGIDAWAREIDPSMPVY